MIKFTQSETKKTTSNVVTMMSCSFVPLIASLWDISIDNNN